MKKALGHKKIYIYVQYIYIYVYIYLTRNTIYFKNKK